MLAKNFLDCLKKLQWGFVFRGVAVVLLSFSVIIPLTIMIILAPIVGQPIYNMAVFQPLKYPAGKYEKLTAGGIKPEEVFFPSDSGNKLHGLMYSLPMAKHVILLSHGNSGNISQRCHIVAILLKDGVSVFVYDYAGFGRSEGVSNLDSLAKDGRGAYKYLTKVRRLDPEDIILFGESLGTLVTGKLAQTVDCGAVILECPLYSLRRVGCDVLSFLKWYPDFAWSNSCKQLDNSQFLKHKRAPLLLIAGTADKLTGIEQSDDLYAVVAEPKTYIRIEGAKHGDAVMMKSAKYKLGLKKFLASI